MSSQPVGEAVAMPQASVTPASIEDLLERVLLGEGGDRVRAMLDAINQGTADVFVADYGCGSLTDPQVFTFRQLCRHLFTEDHPARVSARGYRLHTPANVIPWHEELGGHGPGLKRGPA